MLWVGLDLRVRARLCGTIIVAAISWEYGLAWVLLPFYLAGGFTAWGCQLAAHPSALYIPMQFGMAGGQYSNTTILSSESNTHVRLAAAAGRIILYYVETKARRMPDLLSPVA